MKTIRSICLQWIARLFKKGDRATQRANQAASCINTASQMAGNNYLGPNATIWQGNHGVGDQFKNNYTSLESLCGNALKKNEWSSTVAAAMMSKRNSQLARSSFIQALIDIGAILAGLVLISLFAVAIAVAIAVPLFVNLKF